MMSRRGAIAGLVALLSAPAPGGAADLVVLDAKFSGNAVSVSLSARLRAPLEAIWTTLTDYDHLARFVPGMTGSRVLSRHGGRVLVAQQGEAEILFFSYPIDIVVEADEEPRTAITMKLVRGNLRQLNGVYRIESRAGGEENVLRWDGVVEPDMMLPPFIGLIALRDNIIDQFRGVVREIERRAAAR